jgi:hypothetical protein
MHPRANQRRRATLIRRRVARSAATTRRRWHVRIPLLYDAQAVHASERSAGFQDGGSVPDFFVYGAFGWCVEVLWTGLYDSITGVRVDPAEPCRVVQLTPEERWRLTGHTYLWMFPLYGAGGLVFEPVHDALRGSPWPLRGLIWALLIFAVEYFSGWALRRCTGRCPWDYRYARFHVQGLIRLDYFPLWFAFGLLLERVHDTVRMVLA